MKRCLQTWIEMVHGLIFRLLTTITDATTKLKTRPPCIGANISNLLALAKRPIHPKNIINAVPNNSAANISTRVAGSSQQCGGMAFSRCGPTPRGYGLSVNLKVSL